MIYLQNAILAFFLIFYSNAVLAKHFSLQAGTKLGTGTDSSGKVQGMTSKVEGCAGASKIVCARVGKDIVQSDLYDLENLEVDAGIWVGVFKIGLGRNQTHIDYATGEYADISYNQMFIGLAHQFDSGLYLGSEARIRQATNSEHEDEDTEAAENAGSPEDNFGAQATIGVPVYFEQLLFMVHGKHDSYSVTDQAGISFQEEMTVAYAGVGWQLDF